MRRLLPLTLLLWLCSGCFVLDEIDKGQAIMDQHASKERREAEAAERKAEKEEAAKGGSLLADLQDQVASVGGWLAEATQVAPPERDPDDTVVQCQISGRTHFLRKSDCQIRGGRAL
jgi:hypothetical protein